MAVQAFLTLALIFSLATQIVIALLVTRWPLQIVLDNEYVMTMVCCVGNAVAGETNF